MKKITMILALLALLCIPLVANAQNYSGNLTVYENGTIQYSDQNVVKVIEGNEKATLNIDNFTILSYSGMAISLNATWKNGALTTPATIAVSPNWIAFVLGNLQITSNNIGTLNGNFCSLDLNLYSAGVKKNIRVVFSGTKVN